MNKKMTTITNSVGKTYDIEIVLCFEVPEFNKKYIIYNYPDEVKGNMMTINSGEIKEVDGKFFIENIEKEIEWDFIKKVMMQIVKED